MEAKCLDKLRMRLIIMVARFWAQWRMPLIIMGDKSLDKLRMTSVV